MSIIIKEEKTSIVFSSPISPLNFKENVTSNQEITHIHKTTNCIRISIIIFFTPPHFFIYVLTNIHNSTKILAKVNNIIYSNVSSMYINTLTSAILSNNTILPNSIFTKNNIAFIKNIDKIALTTIIALFFNSNIDILVLFIVFIKKILQITR